MTNTEKHNDALSHEEISEICVSKSVARKTMSAFIGIPKIRSRALVTKEVNLWTVTKKDFTCDIEKWLALVRSAKARLRWPLR
jgi:hypothetical protein